MYFMKRGANKFGSIFSKPGAFIYEKASNALQSDVVEMVLTTIVSFIVIVTMLFEIFPIRSAFNTIMLIIIAIIAISLAIWLINLLVPAFFRMICKVTEPFAYMNEHCKQKLDEDLNGEPRFKTSSGLGVGPKAEVGIKYFIELEKKNSRNGFYKAKYIGR